MIGSQLQQFNPTIYYAFDAWNHADNKNSIHEHDFFEISILLEGEAHYCINHLWQTIHSGELMLFNPHVQHGEEQLPNTSSHQLHIGLGDFQLEGCKRNFLPLAQPLFIQQPYQAKILDCAWQLVNEFNHSNGQFNLICKGLILEMLGFILDSLDTEQATENNQTKNSRLAQVVPLIMTYMDNNYAQDITIEQLATAHFISPTYLSRIFKEVTGISPISYLIQVRLERASELLANETYTIKEIAKAVGYEDAYHFSKSFKKQYGISPSQARKKNGNFFH
uniref:AraC family transcriptional regulator n=1 Tax=Candidatus Enterococcus willemsii TaxID=1857215 RepID=UPI00403F9E3C